LGTNTQINVRPAVTSQMTVIFTDNTCGTSNFSHSTVNIHPFPRYYWTLHVSSLKRISHEPEKSVAYTVKVFFVSSAATFCDSTELEFSVTFKLQRVITEQQIRSARTWPCEMSEGYGTPAAPIYPPFHGHLCNNSVNVTKEHVALWYLDGTSCLWWRMCFSLHVKLLANVKRHTKEPQNIKQCLNLTDDVLRYLRVQPRTNNDSVTAAALETAGTYRILRN
jgi:hypothetical protein